METNRVCIEAIGSLAQQLGSKRLCREVSRCMSVEELLSRVFEEKSLYFDRGDVVVYHRGRVVDLDEDVCSFDEIVITRLVRGGSTL